MCIRLYALQKLCQLEQCQEFKYLPLISQYLKKDLKKFLPLSLQPYAFRGQ